MLDAHSHRILATSQRHSMLAVGDSRLWAADNDAPGPSLTAFALQSLTPVGMVSLPGASGTVRAAAVAGADVWVAAGRTLTEVAAGSLRVIRSLAVGGQIIDITTSPNGKVLWDTAKSSGTSSLRPVRP